MKKDHLQTIKKEINNHISYVSSLKKNAETDPDSAMILQHVTSYPIAESFFNNTDVDDLMAQYQGELNRISEALGSSRFSKKQKILNFLEYIRMAGMYDNFDTENFFADQFTINGIMSNLNLCSMSQSGLNIALLGKGVCASYACFLRDLLITSGENARVETVDKVQGNTIVEEHSVVYTFPTEDGPGLFLDPTCYNGLLHNQEKAFNYWSRNNYISVQQLSLTESEIKAARDTVQEYLINRFQLHDISTQLGLAEAGDMDKQLRILAFMKHHLAPTNVELVCRSVILGNREIECGKLLELFYKANNIPYTIVRLDDLNNPRESCYSSFIDGEECSIYPRVAFNTKKDKLTRRFFLVENGAEVPPYWWEVSEERRELFKALLKQANSIAKDVVVPEPKTITTLTSDRQFFDKIKVDFSPVGPSGSTAVSASKDGVSGVDR